MHRMGYCLMSNRKVFPNTFHMILEMSVLSEFEEFVCHTTKVVTPGFHRRQFCQKTVLRLAKLFPTSHAASGWFPRLRKSEPWVSTSPPPPPPHPTYLPAWEGLLPKGQASLHPEEYLEKPIRQTLPHPNSTHQEWVLSIWEVFHYSGTFRLEKFSQRIVTGLRVRNTTSVLIYFQIRKLNSWMSWWLWSYGWLKAYLIFVTSITSI